MRNRTRRILAASVIACGATTQLAGASTWTGNGTDNNFQTSANWDVAPSAGALLNFFGTNRLNPNNDFAADTSFSGITFGPGAGAFTIGGNRILLTGDINDNATAAQSIALGLALDNSTSNVNVTAGGALSLGTITFGLANQSANVSTLNINNNVSASALLVQTNSATANTINVTSGATLNMTGPIAIGATPTTATALTTVLNVAGAGTWAVNSTGNFNVQASSGNNNFGQGATTLDMTNLANFSFNSPTGTFSVGYLVTRPNSLVRLANTSNTITAAILGVANSGLGSGADNAGVGGRLFLGAGNNVLRVNTINIGFAKATGSITFQSASTGSVSITGAAGGASTTDITIGQASTASYGGNGQNQLALAGHTAVVQAGTVTVAQLNGSTGGQALNSTLTFDTGTFSANTIQLALDTSGTAATGASGTFVMGGPTAGSSATGVLNVANNFYLANRSNASGGSANGTFTINGGTANVNCNITDNSTAGTRNTTLTLDGGTLNMTGHNIGSDASPITTVNLNSGTLASAGRVNGTTINVGSGVNLSSGTTYAVAAGGALNSAKPTLTLGSGGGIAGGSTASQATVNGDVSAGSGSRVSPGLGTVAGTLRFANNLTLNGGSTVALKLSSDPNSGNDRVSVGGNLAASGSVNIEIGSVGTGVQVGNTYTLFDYSGTLTGNETNFTVNGFGSRQTFTIVPTATTPGQINMSVGGTASLQLTWIGNANNTWDLQGASNWRDPSLSSQKFFNADTVTFDDTSTNNNDVTLTGQLSPAAVNVSAARNYKFVGAGAITGGTGLTKSLGGTLVVATNNSYTGLTDIQAGTLQVGDGGTSGTLGSGSVNVGSTLVFNRSDSSTFANLIAGGGTMRKVGSGTVNLPASNSFTGQTFVDSGTIRVANFGALGAGGAVTVASGGQLDIGGLAAENVANGFGSKQFFIAGAGPDGSGALVNNGGPQQFNAFQQVILTADATIGGANTGTTTTGRLDMRNNTPQLDLAGFTLTKSGNNQFSLVGVNVTDGNIVVNNGTLGIEAGTTISDNGTGKSITYNAGSGVTTVAWFYNLTGTVTRPMFFNSSGGGTMIIGNASPQASTVGSNMTLNGPVTITNLIGGLGTLTLNGNLLEGGTASSVTKTGPNALILGGANNTYSANTTVSAGTLALSNGGTSNNIASSPVVRVASGATLDVNALSGGGITLSSAASQALVSNGTTSGNVNVGGSTSVRGSGTFSSTVTVGGGNIAPGDSSVATLTATNLTLNGSTITSEIGAGTADLISVPGSFTVSNTNAFTLVNAGATAGTYVLLDYAGSPLADLSNFSFTAPAGFTITPVNNTGNTSIDVILTAVVGSNSTWNVNANGNWSTASNWTAGVPNSAGATANFGSIITAPHTVTVDSPQTVGTVNFDNANKYTIAGASTLTLDNTSGGVAMNVTSGSHDITAPLVLAKDATATVTPAGSTLTVSNLQASTIGITKAGAGNLAVNAVRAGTLTVNAGTVTVLSNGTNAGTSKVALSLAGGAAPTATLDLNNNDLVTSAAKATVEVQVKNARNNGAWNQPGITSTAARNLATTGLGVLSGAEYSSVGGTGVFSGQNYVAGDTLVKYTWNGDANFDGRITFDDYVKIDTGFNTHLTGWLNGDFNYSGAVNFDDYVLIDIAFNQQNGTLGRAVDWISGDDRSESGRTTSGVREVIDHLDQFGSTYGAAFLAAVPEPSTMLLAGVATFALTSRRRRTARASRC